MKTNFSLIFYIRRQKNYVSGPVPIYLRITVNGKRSELSTGRDCLPEEWSSGLGRGHGKKERIKTLNSYLDTLQQKVKVTHNELLGNGKVITSKAISDRFSGKDEKLKQLLQLFTEHNDKMKALIGNGFQLNTLKGYQTSKKHITGFLRVQYQLEDIDIKMLDQAFIENFEFYLKTECGCSAVSAAKYIKHLKKIVNHCVANKWLISNPFCNYKSIVKAKERTFLTKDELVRILAKEFKIERLQQVKDVFVFCCYTGLSYADVKKLKRDEIATGVDGDKWIFTSRQKTSTSSRIPLLEVPLKIIEDYKDNSCCEVKNLLLPVLSNQKMNAYLKEIADLCGIIKHLTFHLARHTFATTVTLSNGVPIETVSKMLGHTDLKTTQHYAKILDIKVSNDMAKLKRKLSFG
ncbi:recombinase [Pedobacter psychrophilus]|uniref:Recombinase n=1 Tax=Pedobacter psychrophilus TaxID=1826909 RepID=A0A179DD62_9SPHI|nr:site-specific integrase [Pedobacter psychrophilus]OAQ38985.1 recombinase [Pedobacter psychrophilus]